MSLLNFGDSRLALAYFVAVFFEALGILQIVALRERIVGLSLLRVDGPRRTGQLFGVGLIVVPALWFFLDEWDLLFRPGLAGAELLLVSTAAMLAAPAASMVAASLLYARRTRVLEPPLHLDGALRRRMAAFGPNGARGWLYLPPGPGGPWPAACLVPSPVVDHSRLDFLAVALAEAGVAALVVDWSTAPAEYPDLLAVVPAACDHLSGLAGVDGGRVAAVGFDLGADLVLRAVSDGGRLQAAVALAPLVDEATAPAGLSLLFEMTLWQALLWRRGIRERKLLPRSAPPVVPGSRAGRGVLVVYGTNDGLVVPDDASARLARAYPASKLVTIPRAGHLGLPDRPSTARMVATWLREHA